MHRILEDRRKNAPNFRGQWKIHRILEDRRKMHRILEDRRENAPNFRGHKGKCTEIKKTEENFTEIKKTKWNMYRTLEDSRKKIYQNLEERRKMPRNLEEGNENSQKRREQKDEITETSRTRGEKHRNPAILLLAAQSMFVAFPILCSKLLLSTLNSCRFVGPIRSLHRF
jgi:hypothetical protein